MIARTLGWEAVGLCRNPPAEPPPGNVRYVKADCTSFDSCRAAVANAGAVTHMVYAAPVSLTAASMYVFGIRQAGIWRVVYQENNAGNKTFGPLL